MSASREAFNLRHPACRRNFMRAVKRKWKSLSFWRLVVADTYNRVCETKTGGGKEAL